MPGYDDAAKSAVLIAGIGPFGQPDALQTDGTGKLQSSSVQGTFAMTQVVIEQAGPGTATIVSGVGGQTSRIVGGVLSLDADATVTFKSNGVAVSGALPVVAKGGFVLPTNYNGYFYGSLGNNLQITTTGGGAHGTLFVVTE